MKDKTTIFDFLNSINNKKKIEYESKDLSGYMLSLWLSHDNEILNLVNDINKHIFNIKSEYIYEYYFSKVPKKKRFIKYIKGDKKKNKLKEDIIGLSEREVQLYKDFF